MASEAAVMGLPAVEVWPIQMKGPQACEMVASLHRAAGGKDTAVVMVTGGLQTRAGSHRQYLRLARCFAESGYTCLRFDLPGLGEASGEARDFEGNASALKAAIDALQERAPTLKRIVLWGLCDGATAAALYAVSDPRVRGLVLVNPWIRTQATQSQALVKTYYRQRLASSAFWMKVLRGDVGIVSSIREWFRNMRKARGASSAQANDLPHRLFSALGIFTGVVRVVIAERDLTGQEFLLAHSQRRSHPKFDTHIVDGADHTFSQRGWHDQLAVLCLEVLAAVPE